MLQALERSEKDVRMPGADCAAPGYTLCIRSDLMHRVLFVQVANRDWLGS